MIFVVKKLSRRGNPFRDVTIFWVHDWNMHGTGLRKKKNASKDVSLWFTSISRLNWKSWSENHKNTTKLKIWCFHKKSQLHRRNKYHPSPHIYLQQWLSIPVRQDNNSNLREDARVAEHWWFWRLQQWWPGMLRPSRRNSKPHFRQGFARTAFPTNRFDLPNY